MKNAVISAAKANCADIVGFGSADRFSPDSALFKIYPEVKTVIAVAFRVLRGSVRGIEEGTTYYQYTTTGIETIEETIMPAALIRISNVIEQMGYTAIPQKRHQTVMQEQESTNPEICYEDIYRGRTAENQLDFVDTAIKCGIGEAGFHGSLLTDEFGPLVRYGFVLTDAVIEPDTVKKPHLCDKCKKCVNGCPGKAISEDGAIDKWKCAAYYCGACGKKNPFMPLDAYASFENRIDIIAGEADVTPELARKIIDNTYFYPPIYHNYKSSICGHACDIECYVHLEERGLLAKKFKTPFRKREKWEFDIKDFE